MPLRILSMPTSMRRFLVSSFLGDVTQQIHSFRASGVISNQRLFAVASDSIDVAIVWGPLAGWYARRVSRTPLAVTPVSPQVDVPFLPFVFDMSMGVRRDAPGLKAEVEDVLARRHAEVERILDDYGVPRVGMARRATHRTEGGR